MSILAPVRPLHHEDHGIEGLPTYLARIARIHGASSGQLIRFLFESKEVRCLVDDTTTGFCASQAARLAGHTITSERITKALDACLGFAGSDATTTLRLGDTLARNHVGAIHTRAVYCPACLPSMLDIANGLSWAPLLWSLSVVTECAVHQCRMLPVHTFKNDARKPQLVSHVPWTPEKAWQHAEARRLVDYCADNGNSMMRAGTFGNFLGALRSQTPDLGDHAFAVAIGLNEANVRRCLEDGARPGLRTVFKVGSALACSPVEILTEGHYCIRNGSLFDRVLMNSSLRRARTFPTRRHSQRQVERIGVALASLLANDASLISLPKFAAPHGVTVGMLRHAFPDRVRAYTLRRCQEQLRHAQRLREQARTACVDYASDNSGLFSMKLAVKTLMRVTGLSKHLLADELRGVLNMKHGSALQFDSELIATEGSTIRG